MNDLSRRDLFRLAGGAAAVAAMGPAEWPETLLLEVPCQGCDEEPRDIPVVLNRMAAGRYEGSHADICFGGTFKFQFHSLADLASDDPLKFCTNLETCPAE